MHVMSWGSLTDEGLTVKAVVYRRHGTSGNEHADACVVQTGKLFAGVEAVVLAQMEEG